MARILAVRDATGPGNRLLQRGNWNYTSNAEGQITSKTDGSQSRTYGYDYRGQFTQAQDKTVEKVNYAMDAFGNVQSRTQFTTTGSVVSFESYLLDGWDTAQPIAIGTENFNAIADLDSSGNVTQYRMFGSGFDDPLAALNADPAVPNN
ncbi:MAG: hypothetical protein ACRCZF_12735 [Gemmataceae bacterium]